MNDKNADEFKHKLAKAIDRLISQLKSEDTKMGGGEKPSESDPETNPGANPVGGEMVWFSLDPKDMEWASNTVDLSNTNESPTPTQPISVDLERVMLGLNTQLTNALFTPIKGRVGRLTDFFNYVESGRDRMESLNFDQHEREAYANWCRVAADVLEKAKDKHGLWLTDDEDDLLAVMKQDIFSESEE